MELPSTDAYVGQRAEPEALSVPSQCPKCEHGELAPWGTRVLTIKDLDDLERVVVSPLEVKRYRCQACGQTGTQALPFVAENRAMTLRLVHWIEQQALFRPFTTIAQVVGVTEGTIRNVFRDYLGRLEAGRVIRAPTHLALREVQIDKKPRCVIFDAERGHPFDIVDHSEQTIIAALRSLQDTKQIRVVTIGMNQQQRAAVKATLPAAPLAVDLGEVNGLVDAAVEQVRLYVRSLSTDSQKRMLLGDRQIMHTRRADLTEHGSASLAAWQTDFPLLVAAYDAAEELKSILISGSDEGSYTAWRDGLSSEIRPFFAIALQAFQGWWPCIQISASYPDLLSFRRFPELSLVTEGGRKQSFDVLRAKLLREGARIV